MKKLILLLITIFIFISTISAQNSSENTNTKTNNLTLKSLHLKDVLEGRLSLGAGLGFNHLIGSERHGSYEGEIEVGAKYKPFNLYFATHTKTSKKFNASSLNPFSSIIDEFENNDVVQKTLFKNIRTFKVRYEIPYETNSLSLFYIGFGISSVTAEVKLVEEKEENAVKFENTLKSTSKRKSGTYIEAGIHNDSKIFTDGSIYYQNINFNFNKNEYVGNHAFSGLGFTFKIGLKI